MTEQQAVLALNAMPGLGARKIRAFIESYGGAKQALAVLGKGFNAEDFILKEEALIKSKGVSVLTFLDEDFPKSLTLIEDAPVCLYIMGDKEVLHQAKAIAMVGSRHAGKYGTTVAHQFAHDFAQQGVVIVSGLARGIDAYSHQGCLKANGKTVGVVGCGLSLVYPKGHEQLYQRIKENGAVISEYAMTTAPYQYNFPWRNRIISALSKAVVVIEAAAQSGALITATYGASQGKEVFVVPANIDNPVARGSNELIRDGAQIALEAGDVLGVLGLSVTKIKQELTQEENQVNLSPDCLIALKALGADTVHLDHLLVQPVLTISQWRMALLELELKGIVVQLPGQFYTKA